MDIVPPDRNKTGFAESKLAAEMASPLGLYCAPRVLGTAISIQLFGSTSNGLRPWFDMLPNSALSDALLREQFRVAEGKVKVPQKPGLGVEIRREAFADLSFTDGPAYVLEG